MPEFVQEALVARRLWEVYKLRPPYQQNDYVGWITRAKKHETQLKRLNQMLEELESGDKYMKLPYNARRKK